MTVFPRRLSKATVRWHGLEEVAVNAFGQCSALRTVCKLRAMQALCTPQWQINPDRAVMWVDEQKGATVGARGSPLLELGGGVVRAYEERGRERGEDEVWIGIGQWESDLRFSGDDVLSGVAERVQLAHRRGGCRPTAAAVVFSRTAARWMQMKALDQDQVLMDSLIDTSAVASASGLGLSVVWANLRNTAQLRN